MKITVKGPSSLEGQRMTQNEEKRDGVTKTSFYRDDYSSKCFACRHAILSIVATDRLHDASRCL